MIIGNKAEKQLLDLHKKCDILYHTALSHNQVLTEQTQLNATLINMLKAIYHANPGLTPISEADQATLDRVLRSGENGSPDESSGGGLQAPSVGL